MGGGTVVSVNVGLPRPIVWRGRMITTGIFKEPVARRMRVRALGVEGDGQADLSVHGGEDKAVYAYPAEHYAYWRRQLPGRDLPWGMFGENLTTQGLHEDAVHLGDRFRIGSAELEVTQPRFPCYKLGVRFGRMDIIKQLLDSARSGFYLAVVQEGEVGVGDTIQLVQRATANPTIAHIFGHYARN